MESSASQTNSSNSSLDDAIMMKIDNTIAEFKETTNSNGNGEINKNGSNDTPLAPTTPLPIKPILKTLTNIASTHKNNKNQRSSLRRNISYGKMPSYECTEAKVLVIYTGGTIGMIRNKKNGNY